MAQRRVAERVRSMPLPGAPEKQEYLRRARDRWPESRWEVVDLGIKGGGKTNACLWLCVIAGLSRCTPYQCGDAALQPILDEAFSLEQVLIADLQKQARPRLGDDVVGRTANKLRQFFCGAEGCMRVQPLSQEYAEAFCAGQAFADKEVTHIDSYYRWLGRVADCEFADQLILSALAAKLRVRIANVPRTPGKRQPEDAQWSISEYPDEETLSQSDIPRDRRIVLGNDLVHFMWLPEHSA